MNEEERATMRQHVMFGPVIDPRESWGFGVLRVASQSAATELTENDPAKAPGRHELLRIVALLR